MPVTGSITLTAPSQTEPNTVDEQHTSPTGDERIALIDAGMFSFHTLAPHDTSVWPNCIASVAMIVRNSDTYKLRQII